ncbi:MAG: decaprenyl-phosphate phosphoribosyltransferase [Candidatus Aminicenantes bacterium]|nr:MAG: decaprenyl-phosphate phosphoribosyltransferase [Candidatus Aminicenantes bacterium]
MRKIMEPVILLVRSMRIHQWVKNVFIFAPMVFSLHKFQLDFLNIKNNFLAFFLFSLVTGCIYVFNDCFDKKKDRLHPDKKKRPIASGDLSIVTAAILAGTILLLSLAAIFFFHLSFFYISIIYIVLNGVYSSLLKKIVILDVMVIAVGFVLRIQIGGVINHIQLSPWILIITFLLAIFLGLIKRRQELVKINEAVTSGSAEIGTRITLKKYNLSLLDQLISITTGTTLISYIIYVVNPDIQQKFHTKYLYLTVPFVVFGIFRYLYLTYVKGKGESPAEIIFSDIPFTANAIIWVVVFILLII